MKHIFIVNPAAGAYDSTEHIKSVLENFKEKIDYTVYTTVCSGDATEYIKSVLENSNEQYRFYACGGDGTLNEVINGVVGYENVSVTVFPCGSGNDYIKYYGTAEDFSNIEDLITAPETKVDVLKVCGKYAINAVHFGLDSFVLKTMLKVRRYPILGGKNAYTTGVIAAFIGGMKTECDILVNGEVIGGKELLLCTISNGKYVGGAYKCAPNSLNNDALAEVCQVNPVSRFTFLKLMNLYKCGKHLENPRFKKYINYKRASEIEISSEKGIYISIDGELERVKSCTVEVIPKAVSFAVPQKLLAKEPLASACKKASI